MSVVATFENGAVSPSRAALVGSSACGRACSSCARPNYQFASRRPIASKAAVVVGLSTFRHELVEKRGFLRAGWLARRLFTMPFSCDELLDVAARSQGAIDLQSEDRWLCVEKLRRPGRRGGVAASLIRSEGRSPAPFRDQA